MSRECVVLRYKKRVKRLYGSYGLIFSSVNDPIDYLDFDDFVTMEVNYVGGHHLPDISKENLFFIEQGFKVMDICDHVSISLFSH